MPFGLWWRYLAGFLFHQTISICCCCSAFLFIHFGVPSSATRYSFWSTNVFASRSFEPCLTKQFMDFCDNIQFQWTFMVWNYFCESKFEGSYPFSGKATFRTQICISILHLFRSYTVTYTCFYPLWLGRKSEKSRCILKHYTGNKATAD